MKKNLFSLAAILVMGLVGCQSRSETMSQAERRTTSVPLVPVSTTGAAPIPTNYRVKRIADGDTITVVDARGADIKVRFACVDAPEIPHTKQERESYNPSDLNQFEWGKQARNRLTQLIHQGGNRVSLDVVDSDRYGRKVAEVRLPDGTLTQEVLVREGLVMVYRRYINNCRSAGVVEQAEVRAKQQQLNIWGDSQFTPPWQWRHGKKS
jgi:endonuclease YncB( thermonuclease family)